MRSAAIWNFLRLQGKLSSARLAFSREPNAPQGCRKFSARHSA